MTQKTTQNPWQMDVRVRERNLKSGALTEKELEKYLTGLPDVTEQAEAFGTSQPALVGSAADDIDEDDDDVDGAEEP